MAYEGFESAGATLPLFLLQLFPDLLQTVFPVLADPVTRVIPLSE